MVYHLRVGGCCLRLNIRYMDSPAFNEIGVRVQLANSIGMQSAPTSAPSLHEAVLRNEYLQNFLITNSIA
jgi:hypothetical protein